MSNQQKILNYLSDGEWKCFANADFFMKDDRTRIAELRKKGYVFESKPCDGRCGVKHDSKLVMRRLIATPQDYTQRFNEILDKAKEKPWWEQELLNRKVKSIGQTLPI